MTRSTQAPKLQDMLQSVATELEQVNTWLDEQYQPDHPRLAPLIEHVRAFRGKQVRAAQILLVGSACGRLTPGHVILAGVVEMIHAATLVHDDLLDGADARRGRDCVHIAWGSHNSVLLGDWIYARAFQRANELTSSACSRELAMATARVCLGEIRQNLTSGEFDLSEQEYIDQIDGKTGALFESGGLIAAMESEVSSELQQACATHGRLAGRAFQMQDDLLDLEGDEERARKSLGTDWANGKMTLPLIRLRDSLDEQARERLRALFGTGAPRSVLFESEFADSLHAALERSRLEIRDTLQQACESLSILPGAESRDALIDLTRFLGSRTR